jgi:hypothetical protein
MTVLSSSSSKQLPEGGFSLAVQVPLKTAPGSG